MRPWSATTGVGKSSQNIHFFIWEQIVELPVIWNAMTPIWRHCYDSDNSLEDEAVLESTKEKRDNV